MSMAMNSLDDIFLSIIIPAYNAEKWIERCIQSVFQIDCVSLEVVVIDDGSTDNTLKIIRGITDERLKYYSIKNAGVSNARNLGIEKSNGKYIWFVDADDLILADGLKCVLRELDEKADVIMFGYNSQNDSQVIEHKPCLPEGVYDSLTAKALSKRMLDPFFAKRYSASYIGGKVYQYIIKSDALKESVRFDKRLPFAEDMCFLVALLNSVNTIEISNQICYTYMIYPGTAAHRYRKAYWQELCGVFRNISNMGILSDEELARIYYRYLKEAVLHYAEWNKNFRTVKNYYLEIIDVKQFKRCIEEINYNDWTILELIENRLIENKKCGLLYIVEKAKSIKNRISEG